MQSNSLEPLIFDFLWLLLILKSLVSLTLLSVNPLPRKDAGGSVMASSHTVIEIMNLIAIESLDLSLLQLLFS